MSLVNCVITKLKEEEILLRFSPETKNNNKNLIAEFDRYLPEVEKLCEQCNLESGTTPPAASEPSTQTWVIVTSIAVVALIVAGIGIGLYFKKKSGQRHRPIATSPS